MRRPTRTAKAWTETDLSPQLSSSEAFEERSRQMAGRNVDRGHAARLRQRVDPVHDLSAIALTLRVREHDSSQRRPAAHLAC